MHPLNCEAHVFPQPGTYPGQLLIERACKTLANPNKKMTNIGNPRTI